jgi:hypothetical protein
MVSPSLQTSLSSCRCQHVPIVDVKAFTRLHTGNSGSQGIDSRIWFAQTNITGSYKAIVQTT